MKLDTEERLFVVYDALICLIIGICKQHRPIRRQSVSVNSKTMILCGDETTICSMVNAWDVMASISISAGENMDKMKSSMSWPEKFKSVPLTLLTPYFVSNCVIKMAGSILSLQAVFLGYCAYSERKSLVPHNYKLCKLVL